MATIVRGTVPAAEFALCDTFRALPAVEIECERIVEAAERSIMPLLWIRHATREELDAALEADPSVEAVEFLGGSDSESLYAMAWTDQIRLLIHMIKNERATVLNAYARDARWHLRMLYPTRSHFSRTHEFAIEHGMRFDVVSVRDMEGNRLGPYELTREQHRALTLAVGRGYYDVPREVALEALADELGISHQALSERLRRGTRTLVRTLFFADMIDAADA